MDLTDIGGAANQQKASNPTSNLPKREEFIPAENMSGGENLTVPKNPHAEEHRKKHWTIDKASEDGQVVAGEVDAEHEEFLKNTEMVD